MSRGSFLVRQWRETGAQLAERYVANQEAYEAAGLGDGDAYLRAFVKQAWPQIGPLPRRYIREGWTAALRG